MLTSKKLITAQQNSLTKAKLRWMKPTRNFDKKNFDGFIVGFIGETLIRGKV